MTQPENQAEALKAAIRAAKLALFVIRKQGVMPNSSWESGFNSDLATAEAALAALPEAPAVPVDDVAWLIELRGSRPTWWSLHSDEEPGWLPDANKALRFARKEDAEAYIEDMGWTDAFASEHMWCAPLQSSPPVKATAADWEVAHIIAELKSGCFDASILEQTIAHLEAALASQPAVEGEAVAPACGIANPSYHDFSITRT
jgi:hypothetical protein